MPRKPVVKVILSPQQHDLLCGIANRLGVSESETMRTALMDYAKNIGALNFERR